MNKQFLYLIIFLFLTSCNFLCENEVIKSHISPDSGKVAILFTRSCGATTGYSTQISILNINERFNNNNIGNIFVSGGIIEGIDLYWENNNNLVIIHDDNIGRIYNQLFLYEGINIKYIISKVSVIEDLLLRPSLWHIILEEHNYLIQDHGTSPPPRFVIIKNLENKEILYQGTYFLDINLQENTIEIVKYYGEYYNGSWTINGNLEYEEIIFAENFMKINEPPEDLVEIANLAQGNGLGLLIFIRYNFITYEEEFLGCMYIRTM